MKPLYSLLEMAYVGLENTSHFNQESYMLYIYKLLIPFSSVQEPYPPVILQLSQHPSSVHVRLYFVEAFRLET